MMLQLCTPHPCISYALVQATVGVGTVLIWYPPSPLRKHCLV